MRYLNARTRSLNAAIGRAARRAKATFVDVSEAFAGHELRCTGASYVNRLRIRVGSPPYTPGSFHPTALGHERLAEVVAARLRALGMAHIEELVPRVCGRSLAVECAIMQAEWHPSRYATSPSASAPSSPSTT